MKKYIITCLLPLLALTACQSNPSKPRAGERPLDNVELQYPDVTFTFRSTGEIYRSGDAFLPPNTIDCSRLRLNTNAFEDAIEAGALVVRIETPPTVTRLVKNEEGKEITETVEIKPVYGGVLALCNVSERAVGPDSRSYRIRGLDDYLIKGRDGLISVVGAVLSLDKQQPNVFDGLFSGLLSQPQDDSGRERYSWMLWLSDRSATFTDYEARIRQRKSSGTSP